MPAALGHVGHDLEQARALEGARDEGRRPEAEQARRRGLRLAGDDASRDERLGLLDGDAARAQRAERQRRRRRRAAASGANRRQARRASAANSKRCHGRLASRRITKAPTSGGTPGGMRLGHGRALVLLEQLLVRALYGSRSASSANRMQPSA